MSATTGTELAESGDRVKVDSEQWAFKKESCAKPQGRGKKVGTSLFSCLQGRRYGITAPIMLTPGSSSLGFAMSPKDTSLSDHPRGASVSEKRSHRNKTYGLGFRTRKEP